jgi:putative Holliday junction resolvase
VRIVGLDVGRRRIGIAISDASRTLARPVGAIAIPALNGAAVNAAVNKVLDEIARLAAEDDEISAIVVGLPRRLDGTPNDMTAPVEQFATALQLKAARPVVLQDERLTSVEAESRLAIRDRNWKTRKQKLDAAAAAIILQDYLDAAPPRSAAPTD